MEETNRQAEKNGVQDGGRSSIVDIEVSRSSISSTIAVIGSGNFGLALSKEIAKSGLSVCIGSRNPTEQHEMAKNVSISTAFKSCNIIIMAIPFEFISTMPLDKLSKGQILVDCSNRSNPCGDGDKSHAEILESLVPKGVRVVKAFNTLSAYCLEKSEKKDIPVASDDLIAKKNVCTMIEAMGYRAIDNGMLKASRQLENIPLILFQNWHGPLLISTLVWFLLYFFQFWRSYMCSDNVIGWYPEKTIHGKIYNLLTNMLMKDIIKTCDGHALNILAACYLPGVLAAYVQLFRGTKYTKFPKWLNSWMIMRKKFGLLMLLSASIHGCYYCLMFQPRLSNNELPWTVKVCFTSGILALASATILGISSLPSVASSLSWREFRALQSVLGWICLTFGTLHASASAISAEHFWEDSKLFRWDNCYLPNTQQSGILLPVVTFGLKIPLLIPLVDCRLTKIRNGSVFSPLSGWNGMRVLGFEVDF